MTFDDARWMARWIGRLSEAQLLQALIASGFDSAHAKLYLEKLVSRRDQMIQDLDLSSEIPLLRGGGTNRGLCYDPVRDGPMQVITGGRVVRASVGGSVIIDGRLVPR
jgi:hypothetical protein